MDNSRHFKAWLQMVRRYDWSPHRRQASAVLAFAALQQAVSKCETGAPPTAANGRTTDRLDGAGNAATEVNP